MLDRVFGHPTEFRYIFILADSGMGKTSALINYYVRHLGRWPKKFKLEYVPLGIPDADQRIDAIQEKEDTILLLDALDEDILALVNYVERLRLIASKTFSFMRVLITCRTQFFARNEEIPQRTGVFKIAARAAGESAEYLFNNIYLSPLSDRQIGRYIRRRYPFWQWSARNRARRLVEKMPSLTVRPMLLAHIDDLIGTGREFKYAFQLYEDMVRAWILREKGFVRDDVALLRFSREMALNLYMNRERRGGERISRLEMEALARTQDISLEGLILTGRSLLNRDAEGNYKFAHRSIMEYLVCAQVIRAPRSLIHLSWTDQMMEFMGEMIESYCGEDIVYDLMASLHVNGIETLKSWLRHNASMEMERWAFRLSIMAYHLPFLVHQQALLVAVNKSNSRKPIVVDNFATMGASQKRPRHQDEEKWLAALNGHVDEMLRQNMLAKRVTEDPGR
jgi:hypothetical protein